MKITNKYLKQLIKEEIDKNREFLNIFVELHNALINKQKNLGKRLKAVDDNLSFEELLGNIKAEKNLSTNDLYDLLEDYKHDIDLNMYEKLRDALTREIYQEDSEFLQDERDDDDALDAEMSDMYQKIYGKPDLRIVK